MNIDNKKYDEARDEILDILRKELIGPVEEKEIIEGNRPDESYCLGILYPQGQSNDENAEKIVLQNKLDQNKEYDNGDTEAQEEIIKTENVEKQSSMGISFNVNQDVEKILVKLKYASYDKIKTQERYEEKWQRIPKEKILEINTQKNQTIDIENGLQIRVYLHKIFKDGIRTITITVLNTNMEEDRKQLTSICKKAFFQIELILKVMKENQYFVEKKIDTKYTKDYEMKNLNLLYRDNKNIAIGHASAAMWDYKEKNPKKIWLDQLPVYITKQMIPYEENDNYNYRRMNYLCLAEEKEVCKELKKFVNSYEQWLNKQKEENDLTVSEKEILEININKANTICERMKKTIQVLGEDQEAFQAFKLMNLAMMEQMAKKQHKEEDECTWYPFQIAFILLSIDAIIDPKNENRDIVDLLWFPTGGGKTEAYLGIIAFTIFLRRIREVKQGRSGAGITAIMRYTLRLLTLQQFQRAAMLICACELIRRKNVELLGTEEISIGLWVGELTENRLENQKAKINKFKENEGTAREKNPFLIKECPWCKAKIKPIQYKTSNPDRIEICCDKCEIEGTLPIYLVDDEIYKHKPTLLLSTIDKYARIPWENKVRTMFRIRQ